MTGKVYLIGAGPGDAELITLKAIKALQLADVLLVDDLVNRELLQHAPQARVVEVGKRGGCKSTPQHFINRMMIALAEQGQTVARLKGGDPFLFGRGGEEMQALQAAGIRVEIIPGITSGMAVPASIGIPITHREYTHGVTFVTGHTQNGHSPNWHALAASGTTLVIYMGMKHLAAIVHELLDAGLRANMLAAAIQHGTLPQQRHVISPLYMLPMAVQQQGLSSPAIIVVGDAVSLAQHTAAALPSQLPLPTVLAVAA
ncbi:MAG: uroporphyrinogen-III C-methyltransferase [Methylophilaceae bacterium]|nr:uroporphyrinogen-III C-methyltransferase [Methylophilaceae bacterium]